MGVTFRTKLWLIIGAALLCSSLVVIVSDWIGFRLRAELSNVESRIVPRLEFGPRLEAGFTQLKRGVTNAVEARDRSALAATADAKSALFDQINGMGAALEPAVAAKLRWTIQEYYETASRVADRKLRGDDDAALEADLRQLEARREIAEQTIRGATGLDRAHLEAAFEAARGASLEATYWRVVIGLASLCTLVLLWRWARRDLLGALERLSAGFARFSAGDLAYAIPVTSRDELGRVAEDANRMAAALLDANEKRQRDDWLKAGVAELSEALRGTLDPHVIAERVLDVLTRRLGAVVSALYLDDGRGSLELMRHQAGREPGAEDEWPRKRVRIGEGLLGRAFATGEITLREDLPPSYLRVASGLGDAAPSRVLFVPLSRAEKTIGVAEFALVGRFSNEGREFLNAVRTMIVVAFEAARADVAMRALLVATQEQAERLAAQEEELRVNNQELAAQQEELRSVNDELEAQQRALKEQNVEIEAARRRVLVKNEELGRTTAYKSQFLANMSHELRTPLNSMLLLSHLLAENTSGNLTPKQVEYSSTIHSAGEDLLSLINQVLDLSKIESGKQEAEIQRVPIERFTTHARQIFEPLARQKGLDFVVEVDPAVPTEIDTDRQRVERILTNLLGNAVKFTEHGRVSLHIGRAPAETNFLRSDLQADRAIVFAVSDTGIGIEESEHGRVFAAFEQVEAKSDRRYQGTGLGLAIARESAALLGGEIQLESRLGEGSTFLVYLPYEHAGVEGAAPGSVSPEPVVGPDSYLLVIEDDRVLSEQLAEMIEQRGVRAVVAGSGHEGLDWARRKPPLGIILDVRLPDLDGWTIMERLRRDPRTRRIPVHFLSAADTPERGLSLGAIGYLTKPASQSDLEGMVRTLLPHASSGESRKILVVEDSQREGQSILHLLESQGFDAEHVTSAGAAIERIDEQAFGCMILDLGLPDMDGLGLLETLRQKKNVVAPRVIVHTGRSLTKKEARQLESYAEAVILKDGQSAERLLEEIRLFVHHVRKKAPEPAELPAQAKPRDSSLAGVHVLVAEDDMRTIYSLSALLQSRGAEVIVAENGREAIELLEAHPEVDVVLMDIMMPEMDGYEAMRRIRQSGRHATLPIIALTAKAMSGERERCLDAGASDYLAKPVDSPELLRRLRHWIAAAPEAHGT